MSPTAKDPGRRPPARERILATATELFYAHGIRGVGIDRIIAESGVAKATLYAHFKSKDALVLAYLDRADRKWRRMLADAAAAAGDDPREQLVGMLDAIGAAPTDEGRFRGCAFLNTASESPPGSPAHDATVAHKRAVRAWTGELAAAAGAADPPLLAQQLTVLLDGAMAAAALEPVEGILPCVRLVARGLVERATAEAGAWNPRR